MDILTDEETLTECKEAFNFFDENGDGTITIDEISSAVLRATGRNATNDEIQQYMTELKMDKHGFVTCDEFIRIIIASGSSKLKQVYEEKEIRDAFNFYDINGDGYVTVSELQQAMASLGEQMTTNDAKEMIKQADLNGDGVVCIEEFITMMTQQK